MLTRLTTALTVVMVLGSATVALADPDGFDVDIFRPRIAGTYNGKANLDSSFQTKQASGRFAPRAGQVGVPAPTAGEMQWMERASRTYGF